MNTLRWTLCSFVLGLGLSTPALAEELDDNAPQWTPGGHYTAELDLKKGELKLLPLDGVDQTLVASSACGFPQNLDAGVYVFAKSGSAWSLRRTHPEGMPESVGPEAIELAACDTADNRADALRLPPATLLAIESAAVGAIYIHQ